MTCERHTQGEASTRGPLRVVSLHRPDAVSGVSSVGARFASLLPPSTAWTPLVIGPASLSDARSPLRSCSGFSRLSWPDDAGAVEQCALLRDRLRSMRADAVVPNDLPQGFVATALNRHQGQRLAAWVHGDDHDWDELMLRASPLVDAWAAVNAAILSRTAHVAPSLPAHAGVLTGCVEVSRAPTPMEESGAAQANPLRLLYTGRLEKKHKRVLDLVTLADALVALDVSFVLSIAGEGPAATELAEKAWPHVLAGRINLLGPVPLQTIPRLVRANHMLLLTSHYEGAPTSVMEALAQGRPVAISQGCGRASELVRDGIEGIVFGTGDIDALARRMAMVANDRAWLVRAGAHAHALAQRHFSIETVGPRAESFVRAARVAPFPATLDSGILHRLWDGMVHTMQLVGPTPRESLAALAAGWLAELGARDPGLALDAAAMPSREGRRLLDVLQKLRTQGVRRVALYGAGWHTRKLLDVLEATPGVVAIVDDRAGDEGGPPTHLATRPVIKPSAASGLRLDAIVISSDEHEPEMLTRARSWAKGIPVHPLYMAA